MMNSVSSANAGDSKPWPVLALNAVLFQGLWFAAIFQHPLVAALCLLALVMQGLVLRWPQKRWLTLCGIAGGGIAVDSVFLALGWYQFPLLVSVSLSGVYQIPLLHLNQAQQNH